jgi:hypothetical protein
MSPQIIFQLQLVLGYIACLLCFRAYVFPKIKTMNRADAQRAIAALHSFRFFGLAFILPGVVGHNLPAGFAQSAAYGDFATGLLAILALVTSRIRPPFWLSTVAFNVVGAADLIVNYYHGAKLGLPALSGELGAMYIVIIIYVPVLMITHVIAFYLMLTRESKTPRASALDVAAS